MGLTRMLIAIPFLLLPAEASAQAGRRAVTPDAYDGWRSIQDVRLSRDGAWLVYSLVPQDGDGEIVARNLRSGSEHRYARGKDASITADGRFVVFTIVPAKAEVDKAKKDKKKPEDQPKNGIGIMNLDSGEVACADRVRSFKLPPDGGSFVAYLLEPEKKPQAEAAGDKKGEEEGKEQDRKEKKKKEPGTDLMLRELATGSLATLPEVTEYAWCKDGAWLAYSVSSKDGARDGAFARRPSDGTVRTLLGGQGNYKGFAFDEAGEQLAFVSDRDDYASKAPAYRLYHWRTTSDAAAAVPSRPEDLPRGNAVSEHGKLEFSKDGTRLYFGTAAAPRAEPDDAAEAIKVDIWHYRDPELQSMQRVRAEEEKKRSYTAVYHTQDRRTVQLASPEMPSVAVVEHGPWALGSSDVLYRPLVSWDGDYDDYFLVDLKTGARRQIVAKADFGATLSPGGNYVLYFDHNDSNWYSIPARGGERVNLTGKLGVAFQNETWDTPNPPRPYGLAGWTADDRSVLLYDRFDIWEVKPDGSGSTIVTRGLGRSQRLVFRYQQLDPEEKTIDPGRPLLLLAVDDTTKASGYYRASLTGSGEPARLVILDKAFGGLQKAKNADVLTFTLSRFEEFPDLWISGADFTGMRKVSDANPQQARYRWGKAELIDYRNSDGKNLRAVLTRPDDFDPSKKYPLMVYIYEQLTNGLHRYVPPSPGTSINITRYVSNGYVVLQPDIVYDIGFPGESAMKCVVPAVQKVIDMGFIDPGRVGIQGHSWGGYQISYMITRTGIFRAVEAGASVVNMISAYGGIRWGTGMSRAFQYERTQSRIGAAPWLRPLHFIENSPIFWVEKVSTPYLTIHNDEDDAVPWYQGIEFFTALRHLGKEAYMFNYNTEKHGLRQRENQKHWSVHMDEFFDHYLKGAPRPEWMEKGVPYLERGKRDLRGMYEKGPADY